MASHRRLSGMQKQVLGLYRGFLRAARLKAPEERHKIESIVSTEFRSNAKNVDRKNTLYIEYLVRRGKKQLEQLNCPATDGLSTLKVTLSATTSNLSPEDRILNPATESHNDESVMNYELKAGTTSKGCKSRPKPTETVLKQVLRGFLTALAETKTTEMDRFLPKLRTL